MSEQAPTLERVARGRVFSTAVAGVADEDGGRDAAALALDLAGPGCTLVLAALAVDQFASPLLVPTADDARSARAADHAARVEEALAGAPCTVAREVRTVASAAGGLRAVALAHEADLLVVGASRRSPLLRVLGVNDVRAAVDRAPCAVAVAPRGHADGPRHIARVGVGWDRTRAADAAVAAAARLAAAHDASLEVVEVLPETPWAADPRHATRQDADALAAIARRRLATLLGPGEGDVRVVEGNATVGLGALAEEVDLLVVGASLRDGHLAAGATTHGLLRHLGCPLLVVPERP